MVLLVAVMATNLIMLGMLALLGRRNQSRHWCLTALTSDNNRSGPV
jgi:hypothetical protein